MVKAWMAQNKKATLTNMKGGTQIEKPIDESGTLPPDNTENDSEKPIDESGTLPPDNTENDSDGTPDKPTLPANADPVVINQSQDVRLGGGKKHRRRTRKKSKRRKRRKKSRKKRKQKQKGGSESIADNEKPTAEKNASRSAADEMKDIVDDFDKENPPEPSMGSPEELEKLQVDEAPADVGEDGPVPELTPPQSGGAKIAKHPFNAEALLAAVTDKKPAEDVLPEKSGTITVDGHAAATGTKSSGFHGGKKHRRKTRRKRKKRECLSREECNGRRAIRFYNRTRLRLKP